jgi:hypothetical protein
MTTAIIILAYVANVFLNRWLEKIIFDKTGDIGELIPFVWFLSLITTIILIIEIVNKSKFSNWFTGKNW